MLQRPGSVVVLGFISFFVSLCSPGSTSWPGFTITKTRKIVSRQLVWSPFTSHFSVAYKINSPAPSEFSISFVQQCMKWVAKFETRTINFGWNNKRTVKFFVGFGWSYVDKKSGTMIVDRSVSDEKKYACDKLFDVDDFPDFNCLSFRVKVIIKLTSNSNVLVDYPEFSDTCNRDQQRYTANCDFEKKETCGYHNDMCLGPWTVSNGLAPLRDPHSSSCDLLTNLDMAALQSPEFAIVSEGESDEKRSVKSRRKRLVYSSLLLDPVVFGRTYIMTGIINTPTLTKHASFNKAMGFTYFFENYGVHQLVVSMLCVSSGYRVLPMRKDFAHYRLTNGVELAVDTKGPKCLNIHSFLGDCTLFQVQFAGGARGSRLMVDDIYFSSGCASYDNV